TFNFTGMSRRSANREPQLKEVPLLVHDKNQTKNYARGRFLGKGGFARCYELNDSNTGAVVAGKVVSKQLLQKSYQKDKMVQEIQIHRGLSHEHVVKLIDYFEDDDNVYVILELCARRSLMELHKRRRGVTEPEARYFTYQVANAVEYIHAKKIIHRDLKLGNLFINNDMALKIGDFGLATTVDHDGERKKTLCGTPNYIAPEVLEKQGHSYEVDIWAIGCILYTLIVGKPPFETKQLKDTYERIKTNTYKIPCWVGNAARALITSLLAANPKHRPATNLVRKDVFFKGYMPNRLPTSCLTMAPKFTAEQAPPGVRCNCCVHPTLAGVPSSARRQAVPIPSIPRPLQPHVDNLPRGTPRDHVDHHQGRAPATSSDGHLSELYSQLSSLLSSPAMERAMGAEDVCEAPEAMPVFWISKWVDYSDKYGIGYQLCDNSVGVLFNDSTKLVLDAAGNQLSYMDKENMEEYYTMNHFPEGLNKKVTLLKYFRSYMNDHLLKAGEGMAPKDGDELARLPCLRHWFRTKSAIVLHMSNGTLQINFFGDHKKVIVCPLMGAVSFIDAEQNFRVLKFSLIEQHGCTKELYTRLRYAKTMCERLLTHSSSSRPGSLSTTSSRSTTMRSNGMEGVPPPSFD
ncbi:hypothetical protein PENTCL1PPCAC_17953, partial [Pristionchus entomophagus]